MWFVSAALPERTVIGGDETDRGPVLEERTIRQ